MLQDRQVDEFVNADVIAREERVSEIEASRMLLPRIQAMQRTGYLFHLSFFWLPSADMAIERVARRVAAGGHAIPEDVIRRRYERGLDNLFNAYLLAADTWVLMNNTSRP